MKGSWGTVAWSSTGFWLLQRWFLSQKSRLGLSVCPYPCPCLTGLLWRELSWALASPIPDFLALIPAEHLCGASLCFRGHLWGHLGSAEGVENPEQPDNGSLGS